MAPLSRTIFMVEGLSIRDASPDYSRFVTGGMRRRPGGASPSTPSLVLGHVFIHVGRRHELEGDVDLLLYLLAGNELQGGVDGAMALAGGVLEHGHVEIAGLHRRRE